jgi:hypothetical protein
MYLKNEGGVITFPYGLADLKLDNPNTSFPRSPSPEALAEFNVYTVTEANQPVYDPATHVLRRETVPVESNGAWTIGWTITPKTAEELAREAREAEIVQDEAAVKVDSGVIALLKARPSQIGAYVDNNVTDLDSAKAVIKILAKAVSVLMSRIL